MEAISDDEDIPDLPAEEVEFGEEQMEEEEQQMAGSHAPIEEANEEAEGCEYEEIMSDEDDLPEYQYEEDYLVEEWEDWLKPFSPQDVLELPELLSIGHPAQTRYQAERNASKGLAGRMHVEEKNAVGAKLSALVNETSLPSLVLQKNVDVELSQDVPEETGELWVQAVEQACQILPKALVYQNNQEEIMEILFSWVDCGLNFDLAINQQQPVFKIRHMKAGIRLCWILVQCSSEVTDALLRRGVLAKLFLLNDQPHLALSIRLLIFRAIDAVLGTTSGMQFFISEKEVEGKTGYEKVLELLSTLQQSRAKVAAAVIVRKIHLLEVCEKLHSDVLDLIDFASAAKKEKEENGVMQVDEAECPDLPDDPSFPKEDGEQLFDSPLWTFGLPCSLLQSIVSCLKEIMRTRTFAGQLLVQPIRWLPGSKQFQLPKHQENPHAYIYTVFEMSGLLEAISVLLVTPSTNQNPSLLGYVKAFLTDVINSEHGLRFLAWNPKATMVIVKALLQFSEEGRSPTSEDESLFHLGIEISTRLHVVHQLDCIAVLGGPAPKRKPKSDAQLVDPLDNQADDLDYFQAVVHFNCLESMLMTANGRDAIVSVIGMPNFTAILLPYLYLEVGEDNPDTHPTKAACFGYAVDLLTMTIRYHDDARFLEAYADKLSNLIISDEVFNSKSEDCTKLCESLPWLSLAKNPEVFTYDKLSNLSNVVQENLDKLEKFPGELITTLRILCYLTIPQTPVGEFNSDDHNNELIEELKYKYATIQLFSADFHTHLINLMSKLFTIYQQPFLHSSNFVGSEGGFVVILIKPTLALLENILSYIIQARNTDFKDLTAVIPLVQTYILLQAFPNSSPYYSTAQKLKQKVINILLGFTQVIYTTEGEEVLSKSLWTQMMAEIFKYLMNTPYTMVSVITLITELLPLPLPIQTHIPLTEEETLHAIRVRKLWSAHLYSLAPTLQELIHRLGLATHPLLTHSLRRMCVALSDLSAPMALLVAKATLDLLLQTHRLDQRTLVKEEMKGVKDDLKAGVMGSAHASQQTTRALNMLASLVSHAPTKAAVLHLLRGGTPTLTHSSSKAEEKYSSLVPTWCGILNLPGRSCDPGQAHFGAQDCLLMIIYYLLDYENAMQMNQDEKMPEEDASVAPSVPLTGVPHKDLLLPFVDALLDVIRCSHSLLHQIRHSFKIILRLLEHNYGFFYVKSVLDKKKGCLLAALRHLSVTMTKEISADGLALLKDILFLAQTLVQPEGARTQVLSTLELAVYLGWKNDSVEAKREEEEEEKKEEEASVEKNHPLKVLEHLVVSEAGNEEEAEHLYEEISQIIVLLEKESSGNLESCDSEEPAAIGLDSLQALFASRIVWTFPSLEDDLHSLWFSAPSFEDFEEKDAVSVNLLETCRKYAGDFDLLGTLHKVVKGQASHSISPQKMAKVIPKYKPSVTAIRPDRRGRPYVAPMRGRSFGRGINIRSDPFRSRPPNTSRPPSLHVDDFVALESTGHQPTGPTGYNKISFGRGKIMLDSMRARGRARGDNRGRFFHRPPFRGEGGEAWDVASE